jgi:hypothetical protein
MARTHKTAHIKRQMAEEALQEEEARLAAVAAEADAEDGRGGDEEATEEMKARVPAVATARTRSQRAAALQRAAAEREHSVRPACHDWRHQ